jgi:hypothetical protein
MSNSPMTTYGSRAKQVLERAESIGLLIRLDRNSFAFRRH